MLYPVPIERPEPSAELNPAPGLATIVAEWTRIGCLGFGGPPTHIALLRRLCVSNRRWIAPDEFEDGIAATNLLPGPASTQLAIYCAWRLRGGLGAVVGGLCFIVPGLVAIIGLSALMLTGHPPLAVRGAAAGAGAAVPAVAVHAAAGLVPASWHRAHRPRQRWRWAAYAAAGAVAAVLIGPWLVLVLLAGGTIEMAWRHRPDDGPTGRPRRRISALPLATVAAPAAGLGALAWVALKVGALSYGGGFVIIPLMRADAVDHYHWLSNAQFLNAVALGQITPGPVVLTVAAVGYAAAGIGGAVLAAGIAFTPSFLFILALGSRFERLRANAAVQAFLDGAGPAAIGAIAGSALSLGLALSHPWQAVVCGLALAALLGWRRGVVAVLVACGAVGVVLAYAGLAV